MNGLRHVLRTIAIEGTLPVPPEQRRFTFVQVSRRGSAASR